MTTKVLLADNRKETVEQWKRYLETHHYEVITAYTDEDTLNQVQNSNPHIIVLDYDFNDKKKQNLISNDSVVDGTKSFVNGYDICEMLRTDPKYNAQNTPIIMLSWYLEEQNDKMIAFDLGVDICQSKPITSRFLLTMIRRVDPSRMKNCLRLDENLEVNFEEQSIEKAGEKITLTQQEWSLLTHLAQTPNIPCTKKSITDALYINEADTRKIIMQLRSKLGDNSEKPEYIQTINRVGYKLVTR